MMKSTPQGCKAFLGKENIMKQASHEPVARCSKSTPTGPSAADASPAAPRAPNALGINSKGTAKQLALLGRKQLAEARLYLRRVGSIEFGLAHG